MARIQRKPTGQAAEALELVSRGQLFALQKWIADGLPYRGAGFGDVVSIRGMGR
jgi:hypothetical protein